MNDETMKVPDDRAAVMSVAGNEAFAALERHALTVSEGIMVCARIMGVLEAGLFDGGEVDPSASIDDVHAEIAKRIADERDGYVQMRDVGRAAARPVQ